MDYYTQMQMTDNILLENLASDIYDVLLDHKDSFMTTDDVFALVKNKKPSYMSTQEFNSHVCTACSTTCNTYNNIHKIYTTRNFYQFPTFIFSTKSITDLHTKLNKYNFTNYMNEYSDPYINRLDYLDEVSKNHSSYSNFNPNHLMCNDLYPLQFLASCKPEDNKRCADITKKLFMNYDDITFKYENSSVIALAEDNNNLQFMNLCYKKQIDNQKKTIASLEHKIALLQNQNPKKVNNHESLGLLPHLFVIFLSFLIFMFTKFTFV